MSDEVKQPPAEAPAEEAGNMVYIGPTIARIGLKQNTIIMGREMLPQLKSVVETHPVVASLYVSPDKVARARRNLTTAGTLENVAAQTLLDYAKTLKG
jgi:hypothetical protein